MTMLAIQKNTLAQVIWKLGRQVGIRWQPGDRLPSVRELVDELEASHGTVHRAIQLMVQNNLLASKPRQGLFVSPEFNATRFHSLFTMPGQTAQPARGSLAGKRVTIRMNPLSTHMNPAKEAIESALMEMGCTITRQTYAMPFNPGQADGLILINPGPDDPITPAPSEAGCPVVMVTSAATAPVALRGCHDRIMVEQHQAAALAGQHLRAAGCTHACFIGAAWPDPNAYEVTSAARLEGFQAGWGEPLPSSHLLMTSFYSPIGGARAVKACMNLLRQRRASGPPARWGIFAATDELATGFINGAEAWDLQLGRDYQLVGFDGMPHIAHLVPGGVPTVAVPAQWMGRHALDMLLSRWTNPGHPSRMLLLGCTLEHAIASRSSPMQR